VSTRRQRAATPPRAAAHRGVRAGACDALRVRTSPCSAPPRTGLHDRTRV